MRIAFIISSLRTGGAERNASLLANAWAKVGHHVTLITLDGKDADQYRLDSRIDRKALEICGATRSLSRKLVSSATRLAKLREAIRRTRSDVVLSFIDCTNVLTLCATRGMPVPVIVAERSSPRQHDIGPVWSTLRRLSYPYASAIVVQTDFVLEWVREVAPQVPAVTIPNPVRMPPRQSSAPSQPIIISLGRLERVKRFDLLIEAFASFAGRCPAWTLEILGDGSQRFELQQLARRSNLDHRIIFRGKVADPYPFLQRAALFVLASEYEGFPNALLEAMACGLPAISTDCPAGPSTIIRHQVDGLLVPNRDAAALGQAMESLVLDPATRSSMAAAAKDVEQRFSLSSVLDRWNHVLSVATGNHFEHVHDELRTKVA